MSKVAAGLQGRPTSVGDFKHAGQFSVVRELYRSSMGSVHLAQVRERRPDMPQMVVLKRRKGPELGRSKDVLNEYELLKQLQHPNVIRCFGYFWDFDSASLCMVLEYADRGDLHAEVCSRRQLGQHFSNEEAWEIFMQVLTGLAHMHAKGIVHRDIKTLNLLITEDGFVKVADFGVSRQMSDSTLCLNSFYGTPLYLSPEIVEGKAYTDTTDVWSLGVVLYELLTLQPPFNGSCLQDVISAVVRGKFTPLPRTRPASYSKLLSEMLTREPTRRPSAATLLQRFTGTSPNWLADAAAGVPSSSPPSPKKESLPDSVSHRHARNRAWEADANDPSSVTVIRVRRSCSSTTASSGAPQQARQEGERHNAMPNDFEEVPPQPPPPRDGRQNVAARGLELVMPSAPSPAGNAEDHRSTREIRYEERRRAHEDKQRIRVTHQGAEDMAVGSSGQRRAASTGAQRAPSATQPPAHPHPPIGPPTRLAPTRLAERPPPDERRSQSDRRMFQDQSQRRAGRPTSAVAAPATGSQRRDAPASRRADSEGPRPRPASAGCSGVRGRQAGFAG